MCVPSGSPTTPVYQAAVQAQAAQSPTGTALNKGSANTQQQIGTLLTSPTANEDSAKLGKNTLLGN